VQPHIIIATYGNCHIVFEIVQSWLVEDTACAIQASLLAVDGQKRLFFTTVLDTYEEIEETLPATGIYHREDWVKKARWTVDAADALLNKALGIVKNLILQPVLVEICISNWNRLNDFYID
jgi:hypothetical protein